MANKDISSDAEYRKFEREYWKQKYKEKALKENLIRQLCSEKAVLDILRTKPAKLDSVKAVKDLHDKCSIVLKRSQSISRDSSTFYCSQSRCARLELLKDDCTARLQELKELERQKEEARTNAAAAVEQYRNSRLDTKLAINLQAAINNVNHATGWIYFRRWVMPDGTVWFKVGITNNPARREAEQNVLPVPMETIATADVGSIERARALEAAIHTVLDEQRITGANNRELFHLSDEQVATIKAVIEQLSWPPTAHQVVELTQPT